MAAPNDRGRALLEVTNAIVGMHHEFYGRGATRGRTIMQENYLVCFMEGIYTKAERTRFTAAIEKLTGRRVFAFLSQVGIDPDVAAEIFWLEPENDGGTAH